MPRADIRIEPRERGLPSADQILDAACLCQWSPTSKSGDESNLVVDQHGANVQTVAAMRADENCLCFADWSHRMSARGA